jgi:hypothetical protein
MTQLIEDNVTSPPSDTDLVAAVRRVLEASPEPLTLSKIRSALPANFRSLSLEALAEALQRQVAANVLVQYPRYRSPQDRFWDRPMHVHVAHLLRAALQEQPLAASELRRKLPDYAKTQAEAVLEEEVAQGRIHRHPPANSRSGPRFGVEPPDPRTFLRNELSTLFLRLERLGFTQTQLRQAALDLLQEEEWGPTPTPAPEPTAAATTCPTPPTATAGQSGPTAGYSWREEGAPADQPTTTPASAPQGRPAQPGGERSNPQTQPR